MKFLPKFKKIWEWMDTRKGSRLLLFLILLLGAVLRLGMLLSVDERTFLHNDGGDYLELSRQITAGNGMSVTHYRWYEPIPPGKKNTLHTDFARTPGLPLLGTIAYLLPFPPLLTIKILTILLSLLVILFTYILGKEFAGRRCGLLAAAIITLDPYALYYAGCWSTENLYLLFILGGMLQLLKFCRGKEMALPWAGLWFAGAALTRPSALLLPVAVLCFLFYRYLFPGSKKLIFSRKLHPSSRLSGGAWKGILLFLLFFLLAMFPWTLRNKITGGSWNPTCYFNGYIFWLSSSDTIYETYRTMDTASYNEVTGKVWQKELKEKLDFFHKNGIYDFREVQKYYKKWGWEKLEKEPEKFLYILKERFFHFFRICSNLSNISPTHVLILRLFFIPLFLLALAGWAIAWKNLHFYILLFPGLYGLITSMPFPFVLRYRYPVFDPYIAVAAAFFLCCAAGKLFYGKNKKETPE